MLNPAKERSRLLCRKLKALYLAIATKELDLAVIYVDKPVQQ